MKKGREKSRFQLGTSAVLISISLVFSFGTLAQAAIVARAMGLGRAYDVYLCGWALPEFVTFLLGNLLQASLVPLFFETKQKEGEVRAWEVISSLINFMGLLCVFCFAVSCVFPDLFARIVSPGMSAAERAEVAALFVPLAGIAAISGFQKAVINLHKIYNSFIWPAVTGLFQPAAMIIAVLWLAPTKGVWCLVYGQLIGTVAQGVALLFPLWSRIGKLYKFRLMLRDPAVRRGMYLAVSVIAGMGAFRAAMVVDRSVASMLGPGDIGALKYSLQIVLMTVSIAGLPFVTVIYPDLCKRLAANDRAGAIENVDWTLRIVVLLMTPIIISLMVFGHQIVHALLERGAFTPDNSRRTAMALMFLAPSVILITVYHLLTAVINGMGRNLWFSIIGVIMVLLTIPADIILLRVWGFQGLAMAKTAIQLIWSMALAFVVSRYIGRIFSTEFLQFSGKSLIAGVLGGAVGWLVARDLEGRNVWFCLVGAGGSCVAVYAGTMFLLAGDSIIKIFRQAFRRDPTGGFVTDIEATE